MEFDEKCIMNFNENEAELNSIIRAFYEDKQQMEHYKKSSDDYNKEIKEKMNEMRITEFEGDKYKAKITIQKRESFNEDKLLAKLKELNVANVIKTKEYVDMEELENQIYLGNLNASELSNCREIKEIVALKVSEIK